MKIEVEKNIFQDIWHNALKIYYKEELDLDYNDLKNPPYSLSQVFSNPWAKGSDYEKLNKKHFPTYLSLKIYDMRDNFPDENIKKDTYIFTGKTFFNHLNRLRDTSIKYIGTNENFLLALVRLLGYKNIKDYCTNNGIDFSNFYKNLKNLQESLDETNRTKQSAEFSIKRLGKQKLYWQICSFISIALCIFLVFVITKTKNISIPKGQVLRQIADTSTLAKGILGNWYSYNRTYEARNKKDGLVFNKMAWNFSVDKDGFIVLRRHWKAMLFSGWVEFINDSAPQLHFFLNVYQDGSGYKSPVGYRHFNCGIWGENKVWANADTLTCVCTTYSFNDSNLGEPLASREILIRQPNISYDSLKKGVASIPISAEPWLEKFLPPNNSYLFQKPKMDTLKKQP